MKQKTNNERINEKCFETIKNLTYATNSSFHRISISNKVFKTISNIMFKFSKNEIIMEHGCHLVMLFAKDQDITRLGVCKYDICHPIINALKSFPNSLSIPEYALQVITQLCSNEMNDTKIINNNIEYGVGGGDVSSSNHDNILDKVNDDINNEEAIVGEKSYNSIFYELGGCVLIVETIQRHMLKSRVICAVGCLAIRAMCYDYETNKREFGNNFACESK